ncbi:ethylbenzene dehydrogenase-related protein [Pelagibius sp. Alg239-R121]|uniref:ethylbenzene dehydrogenase-related protein n=1 Tax=Pelagibius sp. Alg239-R121 TaxID=2993448 RepID=UPI0024A77787|nr:ethylbenzene dehydrogenase-related protein [Pelagibius sp. Alg239-R121]
MKWALTSGFTAATCVTLAFAGVSFAAGDTIIEANVKALEPGDEVAVARIPDGIYLRSVNDPDDIIWERLPEYRMHLASAPPVHQSVELRIDEDDPGHDVYFSLARTSDRFYVRLRWRDETRDTSTLLDRFRDGAAVQFAIGGDETSYIMGSGPDEPVNIWYWRSDANKVENLAAGGPGSTTRLEEQSVSGDSRYMTGKESLANQWVVVMSRPIAAAGEHQVSLEREQVPMAFALWQGSDGQRDGLKRVSEDWILVNLAAQ